MTVPAPRRPVRHRRHEGGFTLIEMLVIILILAVLALIVVYAVSDVSKSAAASSCQSDYKTVETAQAAYNTQMGTPATSFAQLKATGTSPSGDTVGPWLKEAPATTNGYIIGIDDGTIAGGTKGNITVASVSPAHPAADGSANCAYA